MISQKTLYETGTLKSGHPIDIIKFFNNLPEDQHAEKRLRSRRYGRYVYTKNGVLERREQKDFMQSKDINAYVGDIERRYEPLEPGIEKASGFLEMFGEFRARTGLSAESVIEVHQIRWHCKKRVKIPAPEGVHQDGFDFIAIFMVDTANVEGGDIMLYESPDGAPIFKKRLSPGEFVILDDKKLFHYAAPLVPVVGGDGDGHWDLIVLTANNAE